MATYLDPNNVTWNNDWYVTNNKERDKYFIPDGKGNHVLKDGYESRYLGSGDNVNSNGAISTYTNGFDDNHDDYDADKDRKNYGIYKLPEAPTPVSSPAPTPAPVATVAPKPKAEPKGPIEYSPEIQEAKQRVQQYQADQWSGAASDRIFGKPDKETYITKSLNLPTQYVFDANKGAAGIGTPFNGSSLEQAAKASDSFLDSKKSKIKNHFQFQA